MLQAKLKVVRKNVVVHPLKCHLLSSVIIRSISTTKSYIVTDKMVESELIVKKSKFIARIGKASNFEEAMTFLCTYGDSKATHNCWAYNSLPVQRCSDDGEPSGTAGRPMLSAIENENIINTVAIVTRYYGGINLGTGGLARAYGGAVQSALKLANKVDFVPMESIRIIAPVQEIGAVYSLLKSYEVIRKAASDDAVTESINQTSDNVSIHVIVPLVEVATLKEKLAVITKGKSLVVAV